MRVILLGAVALWILPGLVAEARAEEPIRRRAILIGVTAYPNVGQEFQLRGGSNDVAVMARLLRDRFNFRPEEITLMSEDAGRSDERKWPTRANIQASLTELAQGIRAGDQVVVFFAGHGTELPTAAGLAGHFLPRDVQPWSGAAETGKVENAIAGSEIGNWLRPIAEAGATLWVIVDACFTGRMVRGTAGTVRQLPTHPEIKGGLRVPVAAPPAYTQRGVSSAKPPIPLAGYESVVCLYACQADEVTLEQRFPAEDPQAPVLGLLTRGLAEAIYHTSSPLNHRELLARICKLYAAAGRTSPTPLVEGGGLDRTILDVRNLRRPPFLVGGAQGGGLSLNAGRLHGLTTGSILAVFPPPGEGDELRGFIRLSRVGPISSLAEPYAEGTCPAAQSSVLLDGRADVRRIDYREFRLPVFVDLSDTVDRSLTAPYQELHKVLHDLSTKEDACFALTNNLADARVILTGEGTQVSLRAGNPWIVSIPQTTRALSTHAIDKGLSPWLAENLARVARAHALLNLHATVSSETAVQMDVDLFRLESMDDPNGIVVGGPIRKVIAGDYVTYQIKNKSEVPIDVTILYIDANFNIEAIFPLKGEANRVQPRKILRLSPPVKQNDQMLGCEYAVVLAVESPGKEPVELTALANLPYQRGTGAMGNRLASPLGRLFDRALNERGRPRSVGQDLLQAYAVDLVPIEVLPLKHHRP